MQKPIDKQEIAAFNLTTASAKNEDDMGFLLTREGFTKSAACGITHPIFPARPNSPIRAT